LEYSELSFVGELLLGEDAERLISEAIELLRETSSPARKAVHKVQGKVQDPTVATEARRGSAKQEGKGFDVGNAEADRSKGMSPEQSFWFKLADSISERRK